MSSCSSITLLDRAQPYTHALKRGRQTQRQVQTGVDRQTQTKLEQYYVTGQGTTLHIHRDTDRDSTNKMLQ